MPAKVIAIAMDSADGELVERWMDAGLLPGLARLRREGAWGRIAGGRRYRAEAVWGTLLTGCEPERTGYWTELAFEPGAYGVDARGAYDYVAHPQFHALGEARRVAVVDVPQTRPSPDVAGPQVVGWGAHEPRHPSCSSPPELFGELVDRHGRHPALRKDHATFWNPVAVARLRRALRIGVRRRLAICTELLAREPWDLFMTAFSETHSAGHHLLHLSGATGHPLYRARRDDPLLEVYQAVDRAAQELVAVAGDEAAVVVFSPYGMEPATELPSMVFLPELCYRLSFPGRRALAPGGDGPPPPVLRHPRALTWERWLWRSRDSAARRACARRATAGRALLPAGHVVRRPLAPDARLRPARRRRGLRAGEPRRARARRDRAARPVRGGLRRDGGAPARAARRPHRAADRERGPAHPERPRRPGARAARRRPGGLLELGGLGRGRQPERRPHRPVPFARTGTHVNRGFIAVRGPGVAPGSRLADGRVTDVAATILDLVGASPRAPDRRPAAARHRVAPGPPTGPSVRGALPV